MAAWNRWNRKEPQNRVQRFAGRGTDGKRLPLVPPVPLPEPKLPPFVKKMDHRRVVKTSVGDYGQYKGPEYEVLWNRPSSRSPRTIGTPARRRSRDK